MLLPPMKFQPRTIVLLAALGMLAIVSGCGEGSSSKVIPADSVAANDPNTKAKALLDEFFALPEAEREEWARGKGFEFSVFETVTDPQLKSQYDQYVRPLTGS